MNCHWFLSWKLEVGHWQPPSPCFRLEVWTGLTCAGLVQDLYEFMSATVMSHPEAGIAQHPFPSCMLCTPLFYSVPWVVEEGFATDVPCVVNHSWSFSELSEPLWAWINHSPAIRGFTDQSWELWWCLVWNLANSTSEAHFKISWLNLRSHLREHKGQVKEGLDRKIAVLSASAIERRDGS